MGLRRQDVKHAVGFIRSLKKADYIFFCFISSLVIGLIALGISSLHKFF